MSSRSTLFCTTPSFGFLSIGQTETFSNTCTAQDAISIGGCVTSISNYQCDNSTLPVTVAGGDIFSFSITWNLTQAAIDEAETIDDVQILPGSEVGELNIVFSILATSAISSQGWSPGWSSQSTAQGEPSFSNSQILSSSIGYSSTLLFASSSSSIPVYLSTATSNSQSTTQTPLSFSNSQVSTGLLSGPLFPSSSSTLVYPSSTISNSLPSSSLSTDTFSSQPSSIYLAFTSLASTYPSAISNPAATSSSPANQILTSRAVSPSSSGLASSPPSLSSSPTNGVSTSSMVSSSSSLVSSPSSANGDSTLAIISSLSSSLSSYSLSSSLTVTPTKSTGIIATSTSSFRAGSTLNPAEYAVVGTFNYYDCFTDSIDERTLNRSGQITNAVMTLELCAASCYRYNFFGTEYGTECFCGDYTPSISVKALESACTTNCAGNANELCGGSFHLNIYQKILYYVPPLPPAAPVNIAGYQLQGCYKEPGMTAEGCAAYCSGLGTTYFGTEYTSECYCSNANGGASVSISSCSFTCAGNSEEYCGGYGVYDLYSSTSSSSVSVPPMALTTSSSSNVAIPITTSTSTGPSTNSASTSFSFLIASSTSTLVSTPIYTRPSSNSFIARLATITISATLASTTGYSYVGCYSEVPGGHALSAIPASVASKMTPGLCEQFLCCEAHPDLLFILLSRISQ